MIVMGIDPGIGTTGLAAVDENKGNLSLVHSKALTTPAKNSTADRLLQLYQETNNFIDLVAPEVAALETLFFGTNVTTAFSVGQARGVILLCLAQKKVSVSEYNPAGIKIAITGYGNAPKGQMQKMVSQILKLKKTLTPDDVADAAAVAITHCFSYKLNKLKAQSAKIKT